MANLLRNRVCKLNPEGMTESEAPGMALMVCKKTTLHLDPVQVQVRFDHQIESTHKQNLIRAIRPYTRTHGELSK